MIPRSDFIGLEKLTHLSAGGEAHEGGVQGAALLLEIPVCGVGGRVEGAALPDPPNGAVSAELLCEVQDPQHVAVFVIPVLEGQVGPVTGDQGVEGR